MPGEDLHLSRRASLQARWTPVFTGVTRGEQYWSKPGGLSHICSLDQPDAGSSGPRRELSLKVAALSCLEG